MSFTDVVLFLFDGFKISMLIFAVTLLCGAPLGLPIAFCSMSRFKPIKYIAKVFVWIIRGVPLMLQIFIIYYGVPLLIQVGCGLFVNYICPELERTFSLDLLTMLELQGPKLESILHFDLWNALDLHFTVFPEDGVAQLSSVGRVIAVLIAFIINYACYFSEIYRGGIESISKGQYEAGYVLGLSKSQIFRKIVLKQVIQRIVPPMSNEIITLIKDTALANCITVPEIIFQAKTLAAEDALIWPLFFTSVFYLLFVGILTLVLGALEKKLSYFRS